MDKYIPIICLIFGLVLGVAVTIVGFRLGFRASYEIRDHKDSEGKGIFKGKEPAEFELLDEK